MNTIKEINKLLSKYDSNEMCEILYKIITCDVDNIKEDNRPHLSSNITIDDQLECMKLLYYRFY